MQSTQPKLIALDLDGTLLSSKGEISKRSQRALKKLQKQNVLIVLCTGRPPRYTIPLAKELNLLHPFIVYNGAAIVNLKSGETRYRHQLKGDLAIEVIQLMRNTYPGIMTSIETHHGWYVDSALLNDQDAWRLNKGQHPPTGIGDVCDFIQDNVVKILFRHPNYTTQILHKNLKDLNIYVTWSNNRLLEVLHHNTNKQEALKFMSETLGILPQEVAAFGDNNNDKDMLSWAGFGVAMGNASEDAKKAAKLITRSNDLDGVAHVLETWIHD